MHIKDVFAPIFKMENSLCKKCGKPMDRQGYYCKSCLQKKNKENRENRKFYRKNGLCTYCGKATVLGNDKTCFECRAKRMEYVKMAGTKQDNSVYMKIMYTRRKENGLCPQCGTRKPAQGRTRCFICLNKNAEYARNRRLNKV